MHSSLSKEMHNDKADHDFFVIPRRRFLAMARQAAACLGEALAKSEGWNPVIVKPYCLKKALTTYN
jgi:hypothetical protein